MNGDLSTILRQLIAQKDLPEEVLIDAVQAALQAAAKKRYGAVGDVKVDFDPAVGEVRIFVAKRVVDIMHNYATEIPIEEARKVDPEAEIGEFIQVQADTHDFGRIEAQTARQILVQKLKEAEREMIYEEYKDREGEVMTGTVQRMERGDVYVELERTEGVLPYSEQVRRETYHRGDQLRFLIIEVLPSSSKGAPVILSRSDPGLIARLFELEVPEVYDGLVRIMAIARDPGDRAKVAVAATEENIDAVGTCVGMRGSRVQMVVRELRGEKIDVLEWHPDPTVFIANALSPAHITRVIVDEEEERAEVIVPEDQLSLAIGRRGQNARLAARLTGWKIDITNEAEAQSSIRDRLLGDVFKSDEELAQEAAEEQAAMVADLTQIEGVGEKTAMMLMEHGYNNVGAIAAGNVDELTNVPGIGAKTAERMIEAAKALAEEDTNA